MLSAQPSTSGVLGDKVACSSVKHRSAGKVVPPAGEPEMDADRHFGEPKGTTMLRQEITFYSPLEENENHKDSEKKWKRG